MTEAADPASRHFPVAVSAEALALAWARREGAPAGCTVVVDHEISPRGRLGRLWPHPAERTAVLAMVWRPGIAPEAADLVWSAASLGLSHAADVLTAAATKVSWPDEVVDDAGRLVGAVRAEVQLGPGQVTSAIVTARLDLDRLDGRSRDAALAAIATGLADAADELGSDPASVRAAVDERSALRGRRLIAHLLPKGEVRGRAGGIDERGALDLVSSTGLHQRVPIAGFDRLTAVG